MQSKNQFKYSTYLNILNNYKYITFVQYNTYNYNNMESIEFFKILKDLNLNHCIIKNKIFLNLLKNSKHKSSLNLIQGPILLIYSNDFIFSKKLLETLTKLNLFIIGVFFEKKYITYNKLKEILNISKEDSFIKLVNLQNKPIFLFNSLILKELQKLILLLRRI